MGFNIEQYEEAITNNTSENWSNATGYTKAELISKIRTAKDSIEKLQGDYNSAQVNYDEANGRSCPSPCRGKCHPKCDTKERDKSTYSTALNTAYSAINTAKSNIVAWQTELDDLIEKEANTVAPNTGSGTTGGGTTGGGTATTPSASKTKNYLIIGGAVLVLGVVGFFVFRKK